MSKFHPEYREYYTGENNESYHRGDSWYWINHIAAIAMHQVDSKYYRKTVTDVILASTKDLLQLGSLGYVSEVSSAARQEAAGCFAQLWSVATYLELVKTVYSPETDEQER